MRDQPNRVRDRKLRSYVVTRLSVKVVLNCSWTDFSVRLGQLYTGDSLKGVTYIESQHVVVAYHAICMVHSAIDCQM